MHAVILLLLLSLSCFPALESDNYALFILLVAFPFIGSFDMRIAIVTENFLPKVDGVTRTLARLLEHLQANDHQVLVLGPESGMTDYAGAELMGTTGIPFPPYPELKLNFWRSGFTRRLIDFAPHVIHLVDPCWLGAVGLAVIRYYLPETPLVSSYHTNLATYCTHFGYNFLAPTMWKWNRFCHSFSRYVMCPSQSTRRILRQRGFENVRIWPRGIDVHQFSPTRRSLALQQSWTSTSNDKIILLYVGRVSFEKNIGLVLDAYKQMDHSRCHLVIVGHGPAFDEIQAECQRTHTPVTWTGYLQGDALAAAYASADIFAFASTTETFGQVVLEAMASGLPVAGLWAEGVCDLVDHGTTGLLLDTTGLSRKEQCDRYHEQLDSLVQNKEMRLRMGQAAVSKARQYTWWEAMECVVRTYRDASNHQYPSNDLCRDDSGVEEDCCLSDHLNTDSKSSCQHTNNSNDILILVD